MKSPKYLFSLLPLIALLAAACACQQGGASGSLNSTSATGIVRPLADTVAILEFNGGKITAKDVSDAVNPQIKRFAEESIEAYQQAARRILVQKLIEAEAKEKNTSPQALFEQMMSATQVSDAEVDAYIKSRPDLQAAMKTGTKNPETGKVQKVSKEDVKRFLTAQNSQGAQQRMVEGLMAKANVKSALELPREKLVDAPKAAFLGGKDAKVVIHEFSDFQCPFCAKAIPIVKQIKDQYGDKVKLMFRHMPLGMHAQAKGAALAGICAQSQNKFWELHDKMFELHETFYQFGKDTAKGKDQILAWAKDLGIDSAKLSDCMDKPEAAAQLQKDMDDADKYGVNSTPTFFVNGKRVAGALPFEEFRRIIDEELTKN